MSIIEKVKEELKKKKEELEKTKSENYAKNFYKEISNAGKGNQMIVVITDSYRHCYITKNNVEDKYDIVASMISGIRGETVDTNKTIEELSSEYNYVIISAVPTTVNESTTLYVPNVLTDFQHKELADFENQVNEHNSKYGDKVEINKIITEGKNIDEINNDNVSTLK